MKNNYNCTTLTMDQHDCLCLLVIKEKLIIRYIGNHIRIKYARVAHTSQRSYKNLRGAALDHVTSVEVNFQNGWTYEDITSYIITAITKHSRYHIL